MPAKREIPCGLSFANAYNHQPATVEEILVCENFQMSGEPVIYEQTNNMTPDNLEITSAGRNCSFDVSGCEPNVTQLGKALCAALGGDTIVDDAHRIVPGTASSKFIALYRTLKQNIGGAGLVTEVGLGARIGNLSMAITRNSYLKLAFSGGFCDYGTPVAALTPVAPAHPLKWHSLRAGDYKIGINGAGRTRERTITGFTMNYSREQDMDSNIVLDSDQPNDITEGGRTFDFEIARKFDNAAALAEYLAWAAGHEISLEIELIADPTGTPQTFSLIVPHARITGSPVEPTGSGNDPVMAMLKCRAFKGGSDALILITADDGTTTAWAASA